MSGIRQSKRLKAAAGAVVSAATASLSPPSGRKTSKAAAAAAVKATTSKATTKPTAKTTTKTKTTVKAAAVKATESSGSAADAPKADAKQAWGALFAAAKTSAKVSKERPRPRRVDGGAITPKLQEQIDAVAAFEGVTRRVDPAATFKVVAWNVNGLRAVLKRDDGLHLRAYVAQEDPDVFCIGETKIGADELQKIEDFLPQYEHQYWSCAAKKGYAGTAMFSKTAPLRVKDEIVVGSHAAKGGAGVVQDVDTEGRFVALEFERLWVVHTYVPNAGGQLERLDFRTTQWDRAIERELLLLEKESGGKPVVWCGDLNVAHEEIDIHDPKGNRNKSAGFTDAERESFGRILASGFADSFRELHPEKQQFSYFSYRFNARARNKGWRLDYFVVSRALMPSVAASYIRGDVVGSDHVPIGLELKL